MKWSRIAALLLFAIVVPVSYAGLKTIKGDERGMWDIDRVSVICAIVEDVRPIEGRGSYYTMRVAPLATLSGSFDVGAQPELDLTLYAGPLGIGTSVREPPEKGATVIGVIQPLEGGFWVVPHVCQFMPGGWSSVAVVENLADPKVGETVKRLQDVRSESEKKKKKRT